MQIEKNIDFQSLPFKTTLKYTASIKNKNTTVILLSNYLFIVKDCKYHTGSVI